ncbi:N-formylglutamate deformylase [Marivibrio halodurans]|uniref:N-formylglutamate deformylase n=1 Tax=Marivibrio halodurans TaxID=2039722 RepID=A0A8J7RZV4_9PROT|nr:N-formylglutamate deformylase [Marivibrio halodurans]MBP5857762.1 N-formylglutamate deformylase [Marivibrio halodurans]
MKIFRLSEGTSPVLISIPHVGTRLPGEIVERMTPEARMLADTDWHVDRLYDFAADMGCAVLAADYSRYVIDLNRPPDDANLYPGQDTTGLLPIDTFAGDPLYVDDAIPDHAETIQRLDAFWHPYHDTLAEALSRIRERHGHAVLWEAHSIRGDVPRFFEGRLPDLNIGTANGSACAPSLAQAVEDAAARHGAAFSRVTDGRFKGGYSTRHYGRPDAGWHAIQLEIAQRAYMDEDPPFTYRPERAELLRAVLTPMLRAAIDWRPG